MQTLAKLIGIKVAHLLESTHFLQIKRNDFTREFSAGFAFVLKCKDTTAGEQFFN
jgi:hypothetical protein